MMKQNTTLTWRNSLKCYFFIQNDLNIFDIRIPHQKQDPLAKVKFQDNVALLPDLTVVKIVIWSELHKKEKRKLLD